MASNGLTSLGLRKLLVLDALTCLLMGAALCIGSDFLASVLGIPASFVLWAGAILFPCAALMGVAAAPAKTPISLAWLVVIGNLGWVLASLAAAFVVLSPNLLGIGFIVAQAAIVGVMAMLEHRALPRAASAGYA